MMKAEGKPTEIHFEKHEITVKGEVKVKVN